MALDKRIAVEKLNKAHSRLGSWRKVGIEFGEKGPTLNRIARDPDYFPKSIKLRNKVGIVQTEKRHRLDCYYPEIKEYLKPIVEILKKEYENRQ